MAVKRRKPRPRLPIIGWREWLDLPELGVERLKAKVDTGARSSALHAVRIRSFQRDGAPWVRFDVHPVQRHSHPNVRCEAALTDERMVRSSSGHSELRPVIETTARLGEHAWPIELTLTDRAVMGFRLLLGRAAVRRKFVIDPGRSWIQSKR